MTPWQKHLRWFITILMLTVAWGCTDKRTPPPRQDVYIQPLPPQTIISRADIQFQNQTTEALQMVVKDGSLYLTGRPFGFSRWDISSNPESPEVIFAVSDEINNLGPRWVVDWYAANALAVVGPLGLMSGAAGTSEIDFGQDNLPQEINRYPPVDPSSDNTPRDFSFVYMALVAHPSLPVLYGFRQNDYLYTASLDTGSGAVNLTGKYAYSSDGEGVCCVTGATVFQNKVYVAFRQALWFFGLGGDGSIGSPTIFGDLQAINVASTSNYLYVQHEPTYAISTGTQYPRGIYVFDQNGQNVAFLEISPRVFAVSSDNQYLYANNDGTAVRVYKIEWNNTSSATGY